MDIKKNNIFILLLFILVNGCSLMPEAFGPGYYVEIRIKDINDFQYNDIRNIETILYDFGFDKIEVEKTIDSLQFRKQLIHSSFINILFEYNKNKIERILISNHLDGNKPSIKSEINQISDLIYENIKRKIGEENIFVVRKRMAVW